MTTVVATPGQGPDRPQEVSYADIKVSKEVSQRSFVFTVLHVNNFTTSPATVTKSLPTMTAVYLVEVDVVVDQYQWSGSVIILPGAEIYAEIYFL